MFSPVIAAELLFINIKYIASDITVWTTSNDELVFKFQNSNKDLN
ncbi:hypothetical protein BH18THE1_BH18THE1_16270 [soil metagenome]